MKCDNCGEADASVHKIHVSDNDIEHVQLCEACAEDQSLTEEGSSPSVGEFFSDIQDQDTEESLEQCPNCGLSLSQLKKTNKVGCSECYEVFQDQFESIIHRIHGAEQHLDEKEPPEPPEPDDPDSGQTGLGKVSEEQKLQLLEKRLQKRVEDEDYEAAADLRDRIQELKETETDEFTD